MNWILATSLCTFLVLDLGERHRPVQRQAHRVPVEAAVHLQEAVQDLLHRHVAVEQLLQTVFLLVVVCLRSPQSSNHCACGSTRLLMLEHSSLKHWRTCSGVLTML